MDNQQQHWDDLHSKNKVTEVGPSKFALEVELIIPRKSSILELGCGAGTDSVYFAKQGHSVLSTDFSKVATERNQKLLEKNLKFKQLDISLPMPFSDNEFDFVYARLSLHYFTDKTTREIFNEIHRVLKPNGILSFMCKSTQDSLYGVGREIEKDMYEKNGHLRHFFSEEYVKACLSGKFEIDKLKSKDEEVYASNSSVVEVAARALK